MKCVLLFKSIHQVMRAEKLLKGKGMEVDLIPVPREISSDCGVAIELPGLLKEEALRLLEEHNIVPLSLPTGEKGRGNGEKEWMKFV